MLKHIAAEFYIKLKLKRLGRFVALFGRAAAPLCRPGCLPRVIHMFWDQGFENAPPLIHRCAELWRQQNPGWQLNLLDSAEAEAILPRSALPARSLIAAYADMLRVRLMLTEGGVCSDGTCLCSKPLVSWLPWVMAQSDFFAFARPAYDRPLASWFQVSQPEGQIGTRFDGAFRTRWWQSGTPDSAKPNQSGPKQ